MIKPRTIDGNCTIKVPVQVISVRDSIYDKMIQLGEKTFKGDIILFALQHYEKHIDRRIKNDKRQESDD